MKTKLMIFLLASAVAAFAQHGTGSHGGMGGGMGSGSHGPGTSSMGRSGDMGRGDMDHNRTSSQMGKQSPQDVLDHNAGLSKNLAKLLPEGTTPQQACGGFKNLGQCVAAIHVSNNLNIPFADLKTKMTGDHSESLGKAIHDLKPDADAKAEAKRAQKQAHDDLNSTKS